MKRLQKARRRIYQWAQELGIKSGNRGIVSIHVPETSGLIAMVHSEEDAVKLARKIYNETKWPVIAYCAYDSKIIWWQSPNYKPRFPALAAKTVVERRWFQKIVAQRLATKGPTGWKKSYPAEKRRRIMIRAHDGDILAAARACQALANVTKDPETKRKARADAKYLFELYRKQKQRKGG
jgi:hypothetical protein